MSVTHIRERWDVRADGSHVDDPAVTKPSIREIMYDPWHPDRPQEWEKVPEEYKEKLLAVRGYFSPKQKRLWEAIMSSQWYLLPNTFYDRNGDRLRAKRHDNTKTDYITIKGIPAPYNSLTELIGKMRELDGTYVEGDDEREFSVMNIDAMTAARIEPITRQKAHQLISEIRARGIPIYPEIRIGHRPVPGRR